MGTDFSSSSSSYSGPIHDQSEFKAHAGMSFSEALAWLKAGFKVAREGWNGKNQYIQLAANISYADPDGVIHNARHDSMGNKAIVFVGTSGTQVGWLASQSDLLSEDWKALH